MGIQALVAAVSAGLLLAGGVQGGGWTHEPSPSAGQGKNNFVADVTCVSSSDCWAVGNYWSGVAQQTLVLRWDGVSWNIVDSPNVGSTTHHFVSAIDCVDATDCWMVGSAGDAPVILRWDGERWGVWTSLDQPGTLRAVTCLSASSCWAVGSVTEDGALVTFTLRWDGVSWDRVASPNVDRPQVNADLPPINILADVACVDATTCWAVGSVYNGAVFETMILRWDGTAWTAVSAPTALPMITGNLNAVTCAGSECWAVGRYDAGPARALVMHWDGSAWSLQMPMPAVAAQSEFVSDVTCTSTTQCWAVGMLFDRASVTYKTLIMQWDGSFWEEVPSLASDGTIDAKLAAVTCASAGECWAVGNRTVNAVPYTSDTLVLRYRDGPQAH